MMNVWGEHRKRTAYCRMTAMEVFHAGNTAALTNDVNLTFGPYDNRITIAYISSQHIYSVNSLNIMHRCCTCSSLALI